MTTKLAVEMVPIQKLFPSPSNPRHNEPGVPHVAASLRRFGWKQPVVAKPSGEVIAGNTRLKAAQSLGMTEVPVVWFDGSEMDATAYSIADNRTHEFSTWDDEALAKLLSTLRTEDDLDGVGFTAAELDELVMSIDTGPSNLVDPGAQVPPAQAVTRRGDLWILGRHRLLCGDSTSAEDMQRLMGEERAVLLATDPPYLVDYQGGNHPQSWANKPEVRDKHWDDYQDPTSGVEFFRKFLEVALRHCIERVPVYQWHATRRQVIVEEAWKANGLLVHQTIIWVKARAVLTRSHFMWKHEPCFYGWPEGSMPESDQRPPPSETTVWEIDQVGQQDGIHPTQKPLAIFERPMQFHTRQHELVLEPFSGSGSQLIAAERMGRRCNAMEISPAFVDAAIARWEKATGLKATLPDGETFEQTREARGVAGPSEPG
jgi:DNA modification methylase